jgi:hypothetical protein
MCQISTRNQKVRQLSKDKIVYKIMVDENPWNHNIEEGELFAPFYPQYYILGKREYSTIQVDKGPIENGIERGFHSFVYLQDILDLQLEDSRSLPNDPIIVECIIPKGSQIIYGVWGDEELIQTIVSDCIIPIKIIQ